MIFVNHSTRFALLISVAPAMGLLALDTNASAQNRGMTTDWAMAVSTRSQGMAGSALDPLRLKGPMNQPNGPAPWTPVATGPSPFMPDFTQGELFGDNEDIIEIDAHSAGTDMTPWPDAEGAPDVSATADNWLMWAVSVSDSTIGAANGYINSINSLPNSRPVGAEIISFYASGNQNLARNFVGQNAVEATAFSMGYDGTGPGTEDIDALDYAIGVLTYDPSGQASSFLFNNILTYYFSVTPQTVINWNAKYPMGGQTFAYDNTVVPSQKINEPHPGDIYVMTWNGTDWNPIELYRSHTDLGLPTEGGDVDALSVNTHNGVIVFSTPQDPNVAVPQLWINTGSASSTVELTDLAPDGTRTRVVDRLDLTDDKDDIDALCGIEPETVDTFDRLCGVPSSSWAYTPHFPSDAAMMGVSVERAVLTPGGPTMVTFQVAGWGAAGPVSGDLYLFLYNGPEVLPPLTDPFAEFQSSIAPYPTVSPDWMLVGPIPRTAQQDEWEFSIVDDPILFSGDFSAICALQYDGPTASGVISAGSVVSQFRN